MKQSKNGFFIIIVLVISIMLGLFSFIVWTIINTDISFLDAKDVSDDIRKNIINDENIIKKISHSTNTDGSGYDTTSCSGGLLEVKIGSKPNCVGGNIINVSDNIADFGDDDNFKNTYYTGTINDKLTTDSDLYDNDDYSRKYIFGFIPPKRNKNIFYINDKLKDIVSFNSNNTTLNNETLVLNSTQNLTLKISLNHSSGSINIYKIDKKIYNLSKDISIISKTVGNVLTLSGIILENGNIDILGTPYIFDIENFDYAVSITNFSQNEVLVYELEGFSNEQKNIYIVGLSDTEGFVNQSILYQELIEDYGNYFLRSQ